MAGLSDDDDLSDVDNSQSTSRLAEEAAASAGLNRRIPRESVVSGQPPAKKSRGE